MVPTWDSAIRHELDLVEEEMRGSVVSEQELLTEISLYVIGSGGKRIRPAIAILSFKACGGTDVPKVVKIASAFEMIHAATLIHDDINDHGDYRRGRVAAYKKFGTQKALIAGDFLFVKSFKMGGTFDERIVGMVADACTAIAESEMLQSLYEGDVDAPVDKYLKIIEGKTAKPIEAGARVGGYLAKADEARIDQMGEYGLAIGMAFQIIDDILDIVGNEKTLGKPRGSGLRGRQADVAIDLRHGRCQARPGDQATVPQARQVAPGRRGGTGACGQDGRHRAVKGIGPPVHGQGKSSPERIAWFGVQGLHDQIGRRAGGAGHLKVQLAI